MNTENRLVLYYLGTENKITAWVKDKPFICEEGYNLEDIKEHIYRRLFYHLEENNLNTYFNITVKETFSNITQTQNHLLTLSYIQKNTKERNMKNITVKSDGVPSLEVCKRELEHVLKFFIEDVVLMGCIEVREDYKL